MILVIGFTSFDLGKLPSGGEYLCAHVHDIVNVHVCSYVALARVYYSCQVSRNLGLCPTCVPVVPERLYYFNRPYAPINVMPHLPQVRPSRGRGRELVPRFCPEGWGFCTISVFCDITTHNAIVNGEVHIHIEVNNFPLLEVATLCVFHCSLQSL